jgi:outer membrane lipoprotein SlyB
VLDGNKGKVYATKEKIMAEETIRHENGEDTEENNHTGAEIGGIGGAVVGAIAGSMAGPLGTVAGAVIGGIMGAVTSGAVVTAIDKVDHDHTVSGPDSPAPILRDEALRTPPSGPSDSEVHDTSSS